MQGRRINDRTGQYGVAEFAAKYGFTEKTASLILDMHGPSRPACDAAAIGFKKAFNLRQAKRLVDTLDIE